MIYNNELIISNIEQLLGELGIRDYKRYKNRIAMPCPIHGGNKRDAISLYTTGSKGVGNWKCWTNHCEEEYGQGIIQFVQAILSTNGNTKASIRDAVSYIENALGLTISSEPSVSDTLKYKFINLANELSKEEEKELGIPRNIVRQSLVYPAEYFLKRGFSKTILDKYDVGFCEAQYKQMFERVVVPIYDDNGHTMIGCVGRTIQPQCEKCEKFHLPALGCPVSSFDEYKSSKWINSKGFNSEKYLYNFWFAKQYIELSQTAILVEGQGDVWRLEEADIKIGLGLFGSSIKDTQILKLEKLPLINLIIATDNDLAGLKCKEQVVERLSRLYNIITVTLPKKDIGEMSIQEVKEFFKPYLKKYNVY
jgi:5S rRNA maturation endonuclease (ribonuclease M5)